MSLETLETKIETEAETIWDDIKLDAKKVMTILRTYLPGDHEVIAEVKRLASAGEPIIPETPTTESTGDTNQST